MTKRDRKKRMETGPDTAGQVGATQQISDTAIADSGSVEELAEEGNAFEGDVIYSVEDARDPDIEEVTTHEIREDDVPGEYVDDEHLARSKAISWSYHAANVLADVPVDEKKSGAPQQ